MVVVVGRESQNYLRPMYSKSIGSPWRLARPLRFAVEDHE